MEFGDQLAAKEIYDVSSKGTRDGQTETGLDRIDLKKRPWRQIVRGTIEIKLIRRGTG